jgi:hypothetical protein
VLFLQGGVEAHLAAKEAELGDRVKALEEQLAAKDVELDARVKAFDEQLATKNIELVRKTEELGRATLELDAVRVLVVSERGAAELRVQALEAESGQKVRALEVEVAQLRQGSGAGAGVGVQSPGDNQVPPGNEEQAGEEINSPRDEQPPRENEELVSEEEEGQSVESEEVHVRGTTMQLSRWIVRYTGTAHLKCRSLLSLDGVECADECISMKEQGVYTVFVHLKKKARARAVKALLSRVVEITEFNLLELGKKKGRGHHYMKVIQARLATDPVSLHINITRPSEGRQSTRFSAERGARDYGRKLL